MLPSHILLFKSRLHLYQELKLAKFKYTIQFEQRMRLFFIVLALLTVVLQCQELLVQDLPAGDYRGLKKQQRVVPRYYLCGAGVWKRTEMINQPQKCYSHCNRKRKWWGKSYCQWVQKCDPVPPVLGWIRINGISFNYCHFQNWHTKLIQEERGSWDWLGMQMCPENMYVYGFKTKLTERDGMAGLLLLCRSMRNSLETKEVMVFDGEGSWREAVASGNFAVGFKARFRDGYINGLAMQMVAVPYIFAFNFNYQFPKNFNTAPTQIQNVIVENNGPTPMTKQIQINRQRQFTRIWENSQGYLHGIYVSQLFSQSLISTSSVGMPFISQTTTNVQKQEMTEGKRQERVETFKFGTVEVFKVGQKQKDVVTIPSCTRYTIRQIVESANADVPYSLQIGYTNGIAMQYEVINGFYRGIAVGEVKTTVNYEKIC